MFTEAVNKNKHDSVVNDKFSFLWLHLVSQDSGKENVLFKTITSIEYTILRPAVENACNDLGLLLGMIVPSKG